MLFCIDTNFIMSVLHIFTFICIFIKIVNAVPKKKICNDNDDSINGAGTVLFTTADVHKQCWSPEEIAILTTRMILEDLLPDVSVLSIDSNAYVEDIVSYFRLLMEVVKKATSGRKKRITLLALTDLLGGYLQFAVLPIARYAFYAGLIDYTSIEKLIQLFEELKWFLRTNGQGWPKPMKTIPTVTIDPINFETETPKTNSCCGQLIFYETEQRNQDEKNTTVAFKSEMNFPLPFFDAKVRPSSIAVPFKRYALRNIESRKSSYILIKFFIAAIQCLKEKKASKEAIMKFQNNFFGWLHKEVIPKIEDDKFYAAFGGILRVEETLKTMGAIVENDDSTCLPEGDQEMSIPEAEASHKHSISKIILTIMLIMILFWFCIGTAFICYRMRKQQKKPETKDTSKSKQDFSSSTTDHSKWSLFSKSKSDTKSETKSDQSSTGKCKCSTKTTPYSSSYSDYDVEEKIKKRKQKTKDKTVTICYPPFMVPYLEKTKPAVIETKTTMKKLPSIEEISEITTENRSQYRNLESPVHSTPIGRPMKKHDTKMSREVRHKDVNTSGSGSTSKSKFWKKTRTADGVVIEECWCDILREDEAEGVESLTLDESYPGNEVKRMEDSQKRSSFEQTRNLQSSLTKQPSLDRTSLMKQPSTERNTPMKQPSLEKSQSIDKSQRRSSLEFSFRSLAGDTDQSFTKYSLREPDTREDYPLHLEVTAEQQDITTIPAPGEGASADQSHPEESTAEETSGVTDKEGASPHIYACHSSLTGDYANQIRAAKPYIFGYDFQTSSSSDLSDEDIDMKTSTSK